MRVILIDDADGRLSADFIGGRVLLHVKLWRWGPQKLREYRAIFAGVLEGLRRLGYSAVYATPYEADKRAQKLISMFGFSFMHTRNGLVCMRREIGGDHA